MKFEEALKCMREWKEVKYRNDVYYIDKKGRLIVRYSDVDMKFVPCFTAEQIMSEDWEINMLKNKKKINTSEGNVKDDNTFSKENVAQRNSQDDELMKKIFPHKEVINGKIVSVFPYIEEVYPLKDVPQEVVSKMEKTTLTEQWKKGELKNDWYYIKTETGELYIFYIDDDSYMYDDTEEILAPVLSFEECNKLQNSLEHEKMRATHYYKTLTEIEDENEKLEELLKECREYIVNTPVYPQGDDNKQAEIHILVDKINEVLK